MRGARMVAKNLRRVWRKGEVTLSISEDVTFGGHDVLYDYIMVTTDDTEIQVRISQTAVPRVTVFQDERKMHR